MLRGHRPCGSHDSTEGPGGDGAVGGAAGHFTEGSNVAPAAGCTGMREEGAARTAGGLWNNYVLQ
jgi:hypothetical protein